MTTTEQILGILSWSILIGIVIAFVITAIAVLMWETDRDTPSKFE